MTFHSHRTLRHLTRLQLAMGDFIASKRSLLLYVQLVTKARQTGDGEAVSLQLKRRPTDLPAEHPDSLANEEEDKDDDDPREDGDGDEVFLNVLLAGVRMLCRYGAEADVGEAKRLIAIAKDVIGDVDDGSGAERESASYKRWSKATRADYLTARGILCQRMIDFGKYTCQTYRPRFRTTCV